MRGEEGEAREEMLEKGKKDKLKTKGIFWAVKNEKKTEKKENRGKEERKWRQNRAGVAGRSC